ncbi:hypothetical protein ACN28C_28045 [Plantactinospora sp. WMMC1484]|uniref:hypothetical protein n=1 Tax=Plantactinospora sp. WMMC1484 TaxID=3404122 RepID=UPI003BF48C83
MTIRNRVRGLLRSGRQHTVIPVLTLLAGVAGAQVVTLVVPRSYEATASVMVVPQKSERGGAAGLAIAQNLAPTVARLAESRQVAADAAATLGLHEELVAGRIRGASEPGLQIVTIRATAPTGPRAAAIANAITEALGHEVGELRIGGESPIATELFDRAAPPRTPVTPKPLLNLALGGLAGLLVGLALTSVRNRFDTRLRRPDQIEESLRLPVLCALPRLPRRPTTQALPVHERPEVAAAVGSAVATLSVLTAASPRCRILVTGIRDSTSVDLVAGLLALGFARHGRSTTLVEGRTTQPTLARLFPGSERCALQQVIAGDRVPEPVSGVASLAVVPADPIGRSFGAQPPDSERIGALLDELAERSGAVVTTASPLLTGTDLPVLARHADAVLLVVHANRTRKGEASRATLLLQRLDVPLLGVLVVGATGDLDTPVPAAWPVVQPVHGVRQYGVRHHDVPAGAVLAPPVPDTSSVPTGGRLEPAAGTGPAAEPDPTPGPVVDPQPVRSRSSTQPKPQSPTRARGQATAPSPARSRTRPDASNPSRLGAALNRDRT